MPNDSDNVTVPSTGAIYWAPQGTALPADADDVLDPAFTANELGYLDDTGIQEAQGENVTNIKAFQNSAVVRKILTEHDLTYAFVALERNPVVLEAYYGNFTDGVVEIKGEVAPIVSWVIDLVDGDKLIRIVIENGQLTTRGTVQYGSTDATKYPMTVSCFPGTEDVKATIYNGDLTGS